MNVTSAGDRLVVTVSGELDLDCTQQLHRTLSHALEHADADLELDLAGVAFCDCSALNVLLHIRRLAHTDAKSLILRATRPAVKRLMTLTDTLPLFAPDSAGSDEGLAAPSKPAHPTYSSSDLAAENAQLRRALRTRATIDMARGMLMSSFHLTPQQSWQVLVTTSQHSNTKLHLIANALLQTADGRTLPDPLAGHLATAVQAHGNPAA
ncbi:ANTAR domain-containing protein [Streptomyces adustus]|uniref:ANTAR domain-containing protein n=1 Tax=Streptomyces adustus TaxID=1609272 RepID=UPI001EE4CA1C|nr:ANTAR domain-containing protein [Streptomyces adustus]